jgi:hypothetical protein
MPDAMTDEALENAEKLTIELQHGGPIPLTDFAYALQRLASRYAREARAAGDTEEPRLYISEIRKGSVIVDLVTDPTAVGMAVAGTVWAGITHGNTLISFAKGLLDLQKHFTGETKKGDITKADCDDMRALAAPVLNTIDGRLGIGTNYGSVHQIFVSMSQDEARVIDNRAALERNELTKHEENIHTEVLFVWDQVRDAPGVEAGRSPDKGIITVLDPKPRQVTFTSDDLKESMGRRDHHPFEKAFVVDVKELKGPGVSAYRILKLHDVLDRE